MITVTDAAKSQMCDILERNHEVVVRYELSGGGCGGLLGSWKTESHYEPDMNEWIWYLTDEYKFVLDEATATYMDNAKIDFGGDFTVAGGTFKIVFPAATASNAIVRID